MPVLYTPHFAQFFDDAGNPLSGGKLYTYAAGTTTPKATYTTAAGTTAHSNPIILDSAGRAVIFLSGSYKYVLHNSADVPVNNGTTDNVTAFNATSEFGNGFFQTFSGDGETVTFTLTDNLGNDENSLMVFAETEFVKNGTFASDTIWNKGAGWTISAGVATATGAISTALDQSAAFSVVQGKAYEVRYTVTRSAGSVTPNVGGTAGTARSASGTYAEVIICGSTQVISFTTSGFTGTLDNVSVRELGGLQIKSPSSFTLSGTTLTFSGNAPASGINNIYVFAPYTLINAAGAASIAADEAIAAAGTATAAASSAAASEAAITAAIGQISDMTVDQFTGDGTQTVFALSINPTNENNTQVYVNGVYIAKSAYSIAAAILTFAAPPANLAVIEVVSGIPFGAATTAASVSNSTTGMTYITHTNVQDALEDVDAALVDLRADVDAYAPKEYVVGYMYLRDQKSSGTAGGTFTSGARRTRTLNTIVENTITGATLASNQVTLPAGTYRMRGRSPACGTISHQAYIRNVTDGVDIYIGSSQLSWSSNITSSVSDVGGAAVTFASPKTIELQAQCGTTSVTNGFGYPSGFGALEVYGELEIWKIVKL